MLRLDEQGITPKMRHDINDAERSARPTDVLIMRKEASKKSWKLFLVTEK